MSGVTGPSGTIPTGGGCWHEGSGPSGGTGMSGATGSSGATGVSGSQYVVCASGIARSDSTTAAQATSAYSSKELASTGFPFGGDLVVGLALAFGGTALYRRRSRAASR
jgi:hypothetical protein